MALSYGDAVGEFEWDVPEEYSLPGVVESHAASFGDRVALRFRDADGARGERTYADLRDDMNRFANALAEMGVGKGDRVMHLVPRHPDVFAVQLGALKRGALLVPCSSMLKPKDVAYRANDCGASAVVAHESLTPMVDEVRAETPLERFVRLGDESGGDGGTAADGGDGIEGDGGDADGWRSFDSLLDGRETTHDGPALAASDPMSINYTSGTTGRPKPVMHRHRWMRCFELVNAPYWWGVAADGVVPPGEDEEPADLSEELLWATTETGWAKWFWSPVGVGLTTGATQLLYDGEFDPEAFLAVMAEAGVTRLCAVPTQYRMFAQSDLSAYDIDLRAALSAGEPLNREPIEAVESAFGVTPRDGYGQTETVALVTNYPGIEVKPGSMGKPTPGLGTTVIDGEENELGPGEIGEIAVPVGCPGIFDGYYERDDLDRATFSGEFYRTGDLASRDEDGFFFFEGRADDIIISAGYRIGPFEVEDALISHPAVAEAAAVASPHEERGDVVKAYVVLAEGYDGSEDLVAEIQAFAREQTAPYKYPRRVEFVEELPKTSSGKIRRIELRRMEEETFGR